MNANTYWNKTYSLYNQRITIRYNCRLYWQNSNVNFEYGVLTWSTFQHLSMHLFHVSCQSHNTWRFCIHDHHVELNNALVLIDALHMLWLYTILHLKCNLIDTKLKTLNQSTWLKQTNCARTSILVTQLLSQIVAFYALDMDQSSHIHF